MKSNRLHTDILTLVKQDGRTQEGIAANLEAPSYASIEATALEYGLEIGDILVRKLPHDASEAFVVLEPGYGPGHGLIGANYQATLRRVFDAEQKKLISSKLSEEGTTVSQVHMYGPNSRLNVNSTDSSINIVNPEFAEVIVQLKDLLQQGIPEFSARTELLELAGEIELASDKKTRRERYRAFVNAAADHMSVLAPVIAALDALIPK